MRIWIDDNMIVRPVKDKDEGGWHQHRIHEADQEISGYEGENKFNIFIMTMQGGMTNIVVVYTIIDGPIIVRQRCLHSRAGFRSAYDRERISKEINKLIDSCVIAWKGEM